MPRPRLSTVKSAAELLTTHLWQRRTRKIKACKRKEKRFLQNGAWLLQEQISICEGKFKPLRCFSTEELRKATNNYDTRLILASKNTFTVYKAMHEDRMIAVKQLGSSCHNELDIDCAFNEIVMLSQLNHRNVLKILGCCLERASPALVYEYIAKGNLSRHIHGKDHSSQLSWENGLRIANEVADALAYLHTATSKPIVHRDIVSSNILLDEHFTVRVVGFELSVSIPLGETHVKSAVVGTLGSIDPEYQSTGKITEKSDVYSFGVLLFELLSGKKAFELGMTGEGITFTLVDYAISAMKEDRLDLVCDANILEHSNTEDLMTFAELALKCVQWKMEERPTMKEVAQQLRQLKGRL